jgi:hypothetical protein
MILIPRPLTILPQFPDSHYPGPYKKLTICWHHMCGAGNGDRVSLARAMQLQLNNYNWHRGYWGAIDILEGYDLYDVDGQPCLIEGRRWWSNCDAFSGMSKLGYRYIGIEIDGNYMTRHPSDVMLEGAVETLVLFTREGKISSLDSTGHRAFNYLSNYGGTNCPGDYFWARIPEINAEAARRLGQQQDQGEEDEVVDFVKQPDQERGQAEFAGKTVDVYQAYGRGSDYLHVRINVKEDRPFMVFFNRNSDGAGFGPNLHKSRGYAGFVGRVNETVTGISDSDYGWIGVHILPRDSRSFRGFVRG